MPNAREKKKSTFKATPLRVSIYLKRASERQLLSMAATAEHLNLSSWARKTLIETATKRLRNGETGFGLDAEFKAQANTFLKKMGILE